MNSLFLDTQAWDLAVDSSGSIAVASDPYALAQSAATACRTFAGECWYDTALGIPYWQSILGHLPALSVVKDELIKAAETVPGVVSAQVFLTGVSEDRQLTGQIQVTDKAGNVSAASF